MRIGIDYRPVLRPNSRRRGIGKFTASQIEHILQLGGHDFVLYTIGSERAFLPGKVIWRELPQIRRPSRLNWLLDRCRLHKWIDSDGLDLYHATEVTAVPKRCTCPLGRRIRRCREPISFAGTRPVHTARDRVPEPRRYRPGSAGIVIERSRPSRP